LGAFITGHSGNQSSSDRNTNGHTMFKLVKAIQNTVHPLLATKNSPHYKLMDEKTQSNLNNKKYQLFAKRASPRLNLHLVMSFLLLTTRK
jgi:hypothetical protein